MSLANKYKKSKELKWCLRFKTYHPDGDTYDGIVTHIQKFEKCGNTILQHNREIKKAKSPRWLDNCITFRQILEKLKQKDIWPAVEIIFRDKQKTKTLFYIGPITQIKKNAFWIHCYDATGKWEKEYKIGYDEIFKIEFNDNYSRHFNAYMRDCIPKAIDNKKSQ
ncbi:MAG: hypothetical protein ACYTET_08535 [Planctomycetota bacterium]|jgi:hypothetical protein